MARERYDAWMKLDGSLGHLDDIGLRRGIVQASDQRDYLRVYENAVRQLAIPLTDIVMVLQSNAYEAANTLAEAFPAATVHLLGMGAELTIEEQDSLLANVRYSQCQRIASRRDYIRDRLPLRPQVIIEHGTNQSGQKRACFRTLFWSLPPGGFYAVEALESTHDESLNEDKPGKDVLELLLDATRGGTLSAEDQKTLEKFDRELAIGVSAVAFHGTLAIVHKANAHLCKLSEWEGSADPYERGGEVIHLEPTYDYTPRSELHTYGDGPLKDRATINVPERRLRRNLDVICYPAMLATRDNYVLSGSIRHPHKKSLHHPRLISATADFARHGRLYGPARVVDGEFYHFDTVYPGHFGHVTTEQLGHMWGWERAVEQNPSIRPIMTLPAKRTDLFDYQYEMFAALGITRDSIELIQRDEPLHVKSLVSSTPAFENPYYVDLDMTRVWHDLLQSLPQDQAISRPEKIFISRRPGSRRTAVNTKEIEKTFARRGFMIIYPEDLPYVEQVHIFAAAKVIGGFAGSGMFNMMFSPQAKIILIAGDSYTAENEYLIAAANGNEVHYFWGESKVQSKDERHDPVAFASDFHFNVRRHRKNLRAVLS